MKVRHLRRGDFVRQPWRNGGGFTTELAVCRAPSPSKGEGDFLWRLSIADVQSSGPFSDFSGYERTIMLLEGDGMELTFDARPPHRLDVPRRPFTFDGGWKTDCRLLGGSVRDLNLMVRQGAARGRMETMPLPAKVRAAEWTLVLALRGVATLGGYRVEKEELLQVEGAEGPLELAGEGEIAAIAVQELPDPRDHRPPVQIP